MLQETDMDWAVEKQGIREIQIGVFRAPEGCTKSAKGMHAPPRLQGGHQGYNVTHNDRVALLCRTLPLEGLRDRNCRRQ